MTNELSEVLTYYCRNYPQPQELSNARLTKMVYLADWASAVQHQRQITKVQWVFNTYGPWVPDVARLAEEDPRFEIREGSNLYGSRKRTLRLVDEKVQPHVDASVAAILDQVIEETRSMYFAEFIEHVYSTMPVLESPRYATLDLVKIAQNSKKHTTIAPPEVGLTTVEYAGLRDYVDQGMARALLSDGWDESAYVTTKTAPVNLGLSFTAFILDPNLQVTLAGPSKWNVTAFGMATGALSIPRELVDSLQLDGYQTIDTGDSRDEMLMAKDFSVTVDLVAKRVGQAFELDIIRMLISGAFKK